MKIVFVDPKGVWEGLNNGIAYIASNMSDEHEIKVVDFVNRSGNTAKRLDVVKDADIIGISVKSFTLDESIMVANMVKKINPSAKIVAGGPHVMVDGLNLLKDNPIFDLGVFGEAETTFKEILSGKDPADISGVIHRVNGTVIQNPPREWNTDLDKLRFPAYDNFDSFESKIENWPLVTSRGCPYSCTYCFASGTLVHTNKGMIKIEELHNYNDVRVLSHSGKWMPVTRFYKRNYNDSTVKIKARKLPFVRSTKNHKFHVLRNGLRIETPAENIHKGDYLTVQLPNTKHIEYIDVKQILGEKVLIYEYTRRVPFEKIKIAIQLHNDGLSTRQIASKTGLGKSFVHTVVNNDFDEKKRIKNELEVNDGRIGFTLSEDIPSRLPISKDLMRLFGYYLAEGSVSKNKNRQNSYEISWTFNKNEHAYIEDVKTIIKDVLGLGPFIVNQENVTRVCVSNAVFAMLIEKLFGSGSENKAIPDFIISLKPEFLEELMKGWILGDGGIVRYNGKKMIKVSTISHSLAYQFFVIAQKLGLSPSLQKNSTGSSYIDGREVKSCGYCYHLNFKSKQDTNKLLNTIFGAEQLEFVAGRGTVEIRDENAVYFPVESVEFEDFSGTVYNIEVEEDHTYTANGFLVNNCNVPTVIGRKFRTRSGRNIFDELMYAKEKYGSNEFKVLDDNFTLQMDRAKDICKLFLDEKLDMKWTCPNGIRADRLDEELCTLMKQAGCYSMSIGVESGDPDVFDKINKGERLDDVERGIKLAQAAGIKVHGFFIIGLLGSTYEADKRSMEFAKRLGITASWGILVPYPGTEVWEQIKKDHKTRILRDWKEGFHVGARPKPVFDTSDYTAEERVRAYYYANMSSIKKKDIPRAAKMIIKGLISGK
ncbi:MAG TPA: radical SAM protein [Candidatus Aenigmarchaeota archaeon]|nr:radical SAM protein [Candidatus Aenigmarchaeota archaeon]